MLNFKTITKYDKELIKEGRFKKGHLSRQMILAILSFIYSIMQLFSLGKTGIYGKIAVLL